jgi:methyl-accepting chemotaxis protein
MTERRRFPRTRVYKPAKLIVDGRSMVSCVVRDLSRQGACLHLQSTASLPDQFELSFDTGQLLRRCRVAWRTLTNMGVSFEPPAQ